MVDLHISTKHFKVPICLMYLYINGDIHIPRDENIFLSKYYFERFNVSISNIVKKRRKVGKR